MAAACVPGVAAVSPASVWYSSAMAFQICVGGGLEELVTERGRERVLAGELVVPGEGAARGDHDDGQVRATERDLGVQGRRRALPTEYEAGTHDAGLGPEQQRVDGVGARRP